MDELINAMSDEDLAGMKVKYGDNPSVVTLIDGILETRGKAKEQAKAKAKFEKGIAKLFLDLPHPDDIHNVYVRWAEVEEAIPDGVPEEVEVVASDGSKLSEMRQPMQMVSKWIVETNKGFTAGRQGTTAPTASKRAITVSKRGQDNPNQLELVGHFASASKACEYLKLAIGGDSATRVIQREGLFIEPYEGTELTS